MTIIDPQKNESIEISSSTASQALKKEIEEYDEAINNLLNDLSKL